MCSIDYIKNSFRAPKARLKGELRVLQGKSAKDTETLRKQQISDARADKTEFFANQKDIAKRRKSGNSPTQTTLLTPSQAPTGSTYLGG
jgi:hypothetical protein